MKEERQEKRKEERQKEKKEEKARQKDRANTGAALLPGRQTGRRVLLCQRERISTLRNQGKKKGIRLVRKKSDYAQAGRRSGIPPGLLNVSGIPQWQENELWERQRQLRSGKPQIYHCTKL